MRVETLWRPGAHVAGRLASPQPKKQNVGTVRLMHVAAETGARFVRDRIDAEPIEWLLKPQGLFDGHAAIDACSTPEGFRRMVLLHGLGLGIDTAPSRIAGLPADDFVNPAAQRCLGVVPPIGTLEPEPRENGQTALYTSSICAEIEGGHVQIYCAMIARSALEVRRRLRQRYGPLIEDEAQVRRGFDWSEPLATAMVSDAMAHVLSLAAENPKSELAQGLDFQVEQRFVD